MHTARDRLMSELGPQAIFGANFDPFELDIRTLVESLAESNVYILSRKYASTHTVCYIGNVVHAYVLFFVISISYSPEYRVVDESLACMRRV